MIFLFPRWDMLISWRVTHQPQVLWVKMRNMSPFAFVVFRWCLWKKVPACSRLRFVFQKKKQPWRNPLRKADISVASREQDVGAKPCPNVEGGLPSEGHPYPFSHNHGSWNMGPSNISCVSFRVVFHFYDFGRKGKAPENLMVGIRWFVSFLGHLLPIFRGNVMFVSGSVFIVDSSFDLQGDGPEIQVILLGRLG